MKYSRTSIRQLQQLLTRWVRLDLVLLQLFGLQSCCRLDANVSWVVCLFVLPATTIPYFIECNDLNYRYAHYVQFNIKKMKGRGRRENIHPLTQETRTKKESSSEKKMRDPIHFIFLKVNACKCTKLK